MPIDNLVALALATAVLVAIPGPNVALTVANTLRYGFGAGAVTVAGAVAGVGLQLALVVFGLAALVEHLASALTWIKWLGVAYLLVLGVLTWRHPAGDLGGVAAGRRVFGRSFFIAVANPKTLMFNAAFLPQFVPAGAGMAELSQAAAVLLGVIFAGDLCWALFASRARSWLARFATIRNRLSGGFLIAAGVGLALSRR
jgi:threonine/homoserine/homoserine lactone efflux protein